MVGGLAPLGIVVTDLRRSPLTGADGNVEFLAYAARTGAPVADAVLDVVAAGGSE